MALTRQQVNDKINSDIRNKTLPGSISNINHADIHKEINDRLGDGGNEPYTDFASFPAVGEQGKLYLDEATGSIYRWDSVGVAYVQVGGGGGIANVEIQDELENQQFVTDGNVLKFDTKSIDIDVLSKTIGKKATDSNVYYVSVNGDNTTGRVGDIDRPYASCSFVCGLNIDFIKIVILPGTYNNEGSWLCSTRATYIYLCEGVTINFATSSRIVMQNIGASIIGEGLSSIINLSNVIGGFDFIHGGIISNLRFTNVSVFGVNSNLRIVKDCFLELSNTRICTLYSTDWVNTKITGGFNSTSNNFRGNTINCSINHDFYLRVNAGDRHEYINTYFRNLASASNNNTILDFKYCVIDNFVTNARYSITGLEFYFRKCFISNIRINVDDTPDNLPTTIPNFSLYDCSIINDDNLPIFQVPSANDVLILDRYTHSGNFSNVNILDVNTTINNDVVGIPDVVNPNLTQF